MKAEQAKKLADQALESLATALEQRQSDAIEVPRVNEEDVQEVAIRIRDEFEDLLTEKRIKIPSADRTGDPDEACLFGEENSRLVEAIVGLLLELLDTATGRDAGNAGHPLR